MRQEGSKASSDAAAIKVTGEQDILTHLHLCGERRKRICAAPSSVSTGLATLPFTGGNALPPPLANA